MASELPQQELLSAYLDDELSQQQRAQVEAMLASDTRYAELLDQWKRQRQQLTELSRFNLGGDFTDRLLEQIGSLAATPTAAARDDTTAVANMASKPINWRLVGAALASLAALLLILISVFPGPLESNQQVARHDTAEFAVPDASGLDDESVLVLGDEMPKAGGELTDEEAEPASQVQPLSEPQRAFEPGVASESDAAMGMDAMSTFEADADAEFSERPESPPAVLRAARAGASSSVPQVALFQRAEISGVQAVDDLKTTLVRNNIVLQSVEPQDDAFAEMGKKSRRTSGAVSRAVRLTVRSTPGAMKSALTELSVRNDIALVPADKDDGLAWIDRDREAEKAPVAGRSSEVDSNLAGVQGMGGNAYFKSEARSTNKLMPDESARSLGDPRSNDEAVARAQQGYRSRNRSEANLIVDQLYQQQLGVLPSADATADYVLILQLPDANSNGESESGGAAASP